MSCFSKPPDFADSSSLGLGYRVEIHKRTWTQRNAGTRVPMTKPKDHSNQPVQEPGEMTHGTEMMHVAAGHSQKNMMEQTNKKTEAGTPCADPPPWRTSALTSVQKAWYCRNHGASESAPQTLHVLTEFGYHNWPATNFSWPANLACLDSLLAHTTVTRLRAP